MTHAHLLSHGSMAKTIKHELNVIFAAGLKIPAKAYYMDMFHSFKTTILNN